MEDCVIEIIFPNTKVDHTNFISDMNDANDTVFWSDGRFIKLGWYRLLIKFETFITECQYLKRRDKVENAK